MPMVSSMDTITLLMPWEAQMEMLDRLFQAPSMGSKAWRGFLIFSSAEEQPEHVKRHNSKRPTGYYRWFYQVPTTLSTLLLLEIKLLWTGLASGKGAQLLWSYCQQYVLYPSQASEYCRAARFAQHSQHIHAGWGRAIPDPPSGSTGSGRAGSTAQVWPRTPTPCSQGPAALQVQPVSWEKARNSLLHPAVCHTAGSPGNQTTEASSSPRSLHAPSLKDGSCHKAWTTHSHAVLRHWAWWHPNYQTFISPNTTTCSPGRLEKQKMCIKKSRDPSLSSLCLCSISNKTSHRTAAPYIPEAIFPVFSLKASDLSRALPMVPKS